MPASWNRRHVMSLSIAAGLSGLMPGIAGARAAGHRFPAIGLQTFTLGEAFDKDFAGSCEAIADIGYSTLEFGLSTPEAARRQRAILDQTGLTCHSATIYAQNLGGPNLTDNFADVVASAHSLGATYISIPVMPLPDRFLPLDLSGGIPGLIRQYARINRQMTMEDWLTIAHKLDDYGARLNREGLRLAYHNHNFEFIEVGGVPAFDILMKNTDPSLVCVELDVGWVAAAGKDPASVLNVYPDRIRMLHLKDVARDNQANNAMQQIPADIGEGIIDWNRLIHAVMAHRIEHAFIEREAPFSEARLSISRKNYRNMQSILEKYST